MEQTGASSAQQDLVSIYQRIADNPKTPLTLRIGIAGPRHLTEAQSSQIIDGLKTITQDINHQLCKWIDEEPVAAHFYNLEQHPLPILRLTSSLAEGTDRLLMHPDVLAGLSNTSTIEFATVLPFAPEYCEKEADESLNSPTFKDNQLTFSALYERIENQPVPRVVALDGDLTDADSRDKAHYRCAEFLTQNIDLLIVVTPSTPSSAPKYHRAGTATTKSLALAAGLPCIEIHLDDNDAANIQISQSPKFDANIENQRYGKKSLFGVLSQVVLFTDILKLEPVLDAEVQDSALLSVTDKRAKTIIKQFKAHIADKTCLAVDEQRQPDFDYSGPILSPVSIMDNVKGLFAFDSFKRLAVNRKDVDKNKEKISIVQSVLDSKDYSEDDASIQYQHNMFAHFLRADSLAIRYASIHRSTYFLIYVFAAFALITAATALTFQKYHGLVGVLIIVEAICLYRIYRLYKIDHGNHHRWLQNRCLAEAIRPNIYLSPLGRNFSFIRDKNSNEYKYRGLIGHQDSGAEWVCIQSELINRHHGFTNCIYRKSNIKNVLHFLQQRWINGQTQYHRVNCTVMQSIGARLSKLTLTLFFSTVFALSIKAGLYIAEEFFAVQVSAHPVSYIVYKLSGLLTAVFPILGTAVFAIRNHSELDISAQRSRSMLAFFNGIISSLNHKITLFFSYKVESDSEVVISDIFDPELNELTKVSSKEVSDWLEIYEVKESEPG
ncbi:hypothetical protein [Glaciecola sp. 1036]|uniref:hypothetical protein n=1 Tax=Alteromonadaceae TaxID=72275 RepID=UPI003D086A44